MNINTAKGLDQAAAWTSSFINILRDGGTWVVPRSGTQVQVFHGSKTVVIHGPEKETFEKVFAHMGWTVSKAS